jgi:hypothetical protein
MNQRPPILSVSASSRAAEVSALLLLLAFLVISCRALIVPVAAAARYGVPIGDATGAAAAFVRVYASRNLALVFVGGALFLNRAWRPLAVLFSAAALLPAFDVWVVRTHGAADAGIRLHVVSGILLAGAAGLLWFRTRAAERAVG